MGKHLVTFPGKFGDILWSLVNAKEIARVNGPVDFGIMPQYRSLLPLLQAQSYIAKAFCVENWVCYGSPFGDQPWNSPLGTGNGYDMVWDLGYRGHPQRFLPLYSADLNGVGLPASPVPFIEAPTIESLPYDYYFTYGFNPEYAEDKKAFLESTIGGLEYSLARNGHLDYVDVTNVPWCMAASLIFYSQGFLGDRSSLHVLAHGLGRRVCLYEPNPTRNMGIFKCLWGREQQVTTREEAIHVISNWDYERAR